MKNTVLEKFRSNKKSVGTFTHMKSMEAIEALGITGMDFVIIDMEHSPVGIEEVAKYVTAATAANMMPMVRVDAITRKAILKPLDVGAKGVIVPCIENVQQAKELVEYAKYRPVGKRGYCMTRDGMWGYGDNYNKGLAGYMEDANEDNLLILQCETAECLEHIDEIVAVDGIDGIMVGPNDLSIAMGIPGQFTDERFLKAIGDILKACKDSGKVAIIFCHDADEANARLEMGFDSAIVGIDILTLIETYKNIVKEIRVD